MQEELATDITITDDMKHENITPGITLKKD